MVPAHSQALRGLQFSPGKPSLHSITRYWVLKFRTWSMHSTWSIVPLVPELVGLLCHEWSKLSEEQMLEIGMLALAKQLPYILIVQVFDCKLF